MAFATLAYDNVLGIHCQTFLIFFSLLFVFAEHRNSNLLVPYKEEIFYFIKCSSPCFSEVVCFQYRMGERGAWMLELDWILRGHPVVQERGPGKEGAGMWLCAWMLPSWAADTAGVSIHFTL